MAKYNEKSEVQGKTRTFEGGTAFTLTPEHELVSLLSTGLESNFYEKEDTRVKRLVELCEVVGKKDPLLLAKMIVYTRAKVGQRSITHRASVEGAKLFAGQPWAKDFFSKWDRKRERGGVIYRLDDILEITSAYFHYNKEKPLSNAMKKGFASAIEHSDEYTLAKYQAKNRTISLVDVVNMVHPKPKQFNAEALEALMKGTLKQKDTAEDKNTRTGTAVRQLVIAGEITETQAEKLLTVRKGENWADLIKNKKIGYLALLRNLRNILTTAPELIPDAGAILTDENLVQKSLVFPHQIDLAAQIVKDEFPNNSGRQMLTHLDTAYELSVQNVQELGFDEHTAVVFDTSGSMQGGWGNGCQIPGRKSTTKIAPVEKAALIAATLANGTNADIYHFATRAEKIAYRPNHPTFALKDALMGKIGEVGHGTSFDAIFRVLDRSYKRIFIITDMQGSDYIGGYSSFQDYKSTHKVDPKIYTIDLTGMGTSMFNPRNKNILQIHGYHAGIYEVIKKYEVDPEVLLNQIREIQLS